MKNRCFFVLLVFCLFTQISCLTNASPETSQSKLNKPSKSLKVLFLGNSYTYFNNLPQMLEQIAAGNGEKIETKMITRGGATLERLWKNEKVRKTITGEKWDYVVLQEQSTLGNTYIINAEGKIVDPANFHKYARLLDGEIKKSGAKTVFYLTWARENASPREQKVLTNAYMSIARELNARIAPVGIVWQKVRSKNPKLKLYIDDNSHPSSAGSYLAASVFYSVLSGKKSKMLHKLKGNKIDLSNKTDPDKNKVLVDLPRNDARVIQSTAWETYQKLKAEGGYF